MTAIKWEVRAGAYYDSLVLMQLQRGLLELPGVVDAGVVMATQANRDLLASNHLLPGSISASPDDLLIVVKAEDEKTATAVIGRESMTCWPVGSLPLSHRIFVRAV